MSHTVEIRTRVLPGHRIEISAPELPEGSPATVRVTLDEPDDPVPGGPHPDFREAERRYLADLPNLIKHKAGQWVAYSRQGLIAEGDDELALFRSCYERGFEPRQILVARIEPDLPPAEITDNWFPADV